MGHGPFSILEWIGYHVRTIEQVYSINKEYETCYLLSPAAMKAHRENATWSKTINQRRVEQLNPYGP